MSKRYPNVCLYLYVCINVPVLRSTQPRLYITLCANYDSCHIKHNYYNYWSITSFAKIFHQMNYITLIRLLHDSPSAADVVNCSSRSWRPIPTSLKARTLTLYILMGVRLSNFLLNVRPLLIVWSSDKLYAVVESSHCSRSECSCHCNAVLGPL